MSACDRYPQIVLASASPRRRQLLASLGLDFRVVAADVPEAPRQEERPDEMVLRLSVAKAEAIANGAPGPLIIAADTVVALDGDILGKPASELKWGTKIEFDDVMQLISVDDAVAAFERYVQDTSQPAL